MSEHQQIEQQIREILAAETHAITLSEKLFSQTGLFAALGRSKEERKTVVHSLLFKEAQRRFRELQNQEGDAFMRAVAQSPAAMQAGRCRIRVEKV